MKKKANFWDVIYWHPKTPLLAGHKRFISNEIAHQFVVMLHDEGYQSHGPLCSTNLTEDKP